MTIDTKLGRELLGNERVWKRPWSLLDSFTIDCKHCGNEHALEEIESSEDEYPCAQTVAQISVPGLDTFARPTAEAMAEASAWEKKAWAALAGKGGG